MKTITINNRTFEYEVFHDTNETGSWSWTEFYDGIESVTYRKYWLFGPKKHKWRPKLVFSVWCNIENTRYTKKEMREKIEHQLELLYRKEEIERGEIV